ncbi:hypothetical protein BD626DRAFT_392904 [Schizophyllum amplum]|uniref:Arrestin-like N-terminal domain-containing protein n=1 Tax=Schizophyllum amplum TaxID=97359 RepID=A0A550CZC5_9AGAR|nr:hypothetical protein BD626DRAFT_392904 [Auriculariopsis ampla]
MTTAAAPPPYSPACDAPAYTPCARAEERVLCARLRDSQRVPTGHFVQRSGPISIVVYDQEEGATTPIFRKRARIRGSIGLCQGLRSKAEEVVFKVEGRLELAYTGGSSLLLHTIDDNYTLWSSTSGGVCPGELGFSAPLPCTYVSRDGRSHPLPPSFRSIHHGVPAIFARSYYRVRVFIYKKRRGPFGLIAGTERSMMSFEYCPRTRPAAPFFPLDSFLSTIKHQPQEWIQSAIIVQSVEGSGLWPIHCHLFSPSVKVFGLTDKIPVHILLAGPVDSLRQFVPSNYDSTGTQKKEKDVAYAHYSSIRASIVREVMVEVNGVRVMRSESIGEGQLWPIPPSAHVCDCRAGTGTCQNMDWEGELTCRKDITTGGFAAGNLWVQDVIQLDLTPLRPFTMKPARMRVPVRFTTEPYLEQDTPDMDLLDELVRAVQPVR